MPPESIGRPGTCAATQHVRLNRGGRRSARPFIKSGVLYVDVEGLSNRVAIASDALRHRVTRNERQPNTFASEHDLACQREVRHSRDQATQRSAGLGRDGGGHAIALQRQVKTFVVTDEALQPDRNPSLDALDRE